MAQRPKDVLEIKSRVRKRDAMKCTKCGMSNAEHQSKYALQLDVHRLVPGSLYSVDGCITVCKKCHRKLPQKQKGTIDLAWTSGKPIVAHRPRTLADHVAANLRAARAALHISLKDAGEKAGVHYVSISRYEQGKLPTLDALYKLAEAYGVEASVLLPPLGELDEPKKGKK